MNKLKTNRFGFTPVTAAEMIEAIDGEYKRLGYFERTGRYGPPLEDGSLNPEWRITDKGRAFFEAEQLKGRIEVWRDRTITWVKATAKFMCLPYLLATREIFISVDGTDPQLPFEVGCTVGSKFFAMVKCRTQQDAEDIGFYSPWWLLAWACWKQRGLFC